MLTDALGKLTYLHYGLAAVLGFAAAKMLIAPWFQVTPLQSLAVIFGLLAVTIALSLALQRSPGDAPAAQ